VSVARASLFLVTENLAEFVKADENNYQRNDTGNNCDVADGALSGVRGLRACRKLD